MTNEDESQSLTQFVGPVAPLIRCLHCESYNHSPSFSSLSTEIPGETPADGHGHTETRTELPNETPNETPINDHVDSRLDGHMSTLMESPGETSSRGNAPDTAFRNFCFIQSDCQISWLFPQFYTFVKVSCILKTPLKSHMKSTSSYTTAESSPSFGIPVSGPYFVPCVTKTSSGSFIQQPYITAIPSNSSCAAQIVPNSGIPSIYVTPYTSHKSMFQPYSVPYPSSILPAQQPIQDSQNAGFPAVHESGCAVYPGGFISSPFTQLVPSQFSGIFGLESVKNETIEKVGDGRGDVVVPVVTNDEKKRSDSEVELVQTVSSGAAVVVNRTRTLPPKRGKEKVKKEVTAKKGHVF